MIVLALFSSGRQWHQKQVESGGEGHMSDATRRIHILS